MQDEDGLAPFPDNQYHTHTWERLARSRQSIDRAEQTLAHIYRQLELARRVLHRERPTPSGTQADDAPPPPGSG